MCTTEEEKKETEPNARERKRRTRHASFYTTASRTRNEDMNFCVDMVRCALCMTVYEYICCHYMRGGYRVNL